MIDTLNSNNKLSLSSPHPLLLPGSLILSPPPMPPPPPCPYPSDRPHSTSHSQPHLFSDKILDLLESLGQQGGYLNKKHTFCLCFEDVVRRRVFGFNLWIPALDSTFENLKEINIYGKLNVFVTYCVCVCHDITVMVDWALKNNIYVWRVVHNVTQFRYSWSVVRWSVPNLCRITVNVDVRRLFSISAAPVKIGQSFLLYPALVHFWHLLSSWWCKSWPTVCLMM